MRTLIERFTGIEVHTANLMVAVFMLFILWTTVRDIKQIKEKEKKGYKLTYVEKHDRIHAIVVVIIFLTVAAAEWTNRMIPMLYAISLLIGLAVYTVIGFFIATSKDKKHNNTNYLGNYETEDETNAEKPKE